jgi:hypothetical protein
MADAPNWIAWTLAALGVVAVLFGWFVWHKGRPFSAGDVFRTSRWSGGNRLFPTQVLITPASVVQYTPRWIGRHEEVIHIAHIASVKIATGVLFSDVTIETSGGENPVRCSGHTKSDAVQMKTLIERYQTEYFRGPDRRT